MTIKRKINRQHLFFPLSRLQLLLLMDVWQKEKLWSMLKHLWNVIVADIRKEKQIRTKKQKQKQKQKISSKKQTTNLERVETRKIVLQGSDSDKFVIVTVSRHCRNLNRLLTRNINRRRCFSTIKKEQKSRWEKLENKQTNVCFTMISTSMKTIPVPDEINSTMIKRNSNILLTKKL